MDNVRKERLLKELADRYGEAQEWTRRLTAEQWDALEDDGLEGILQKLEKISRMSPEYRRLEEAIVLLHPHRIAWDIIGSYYTEILEADREEQDELLERVLGVLSSTSRMGIRELNRHIYAFWPVPEAAYAALA